MRKIPCHGRNGSIPRYSHLWSTSLLKAGEKFHFGENGQLKCIKSLGNGQILANWKPSWELLETLKEKFQGKVYEKRHREYIRDEKGGVGPIYVLVMSSEPEETTSLFTTSGISPTPSRLGSNFRHIRPYVWVPSNTARPRSLAVTARDEIRQIMGRWRRGELVSSDSLEWDGLRETVASLAAALPLHIENNSGELEQETEQDRNRLEDI